MEDIKEGQENIWIQKANEIVIGRPETYEQEQAEESKLADILMTRHKNLIDTFIGDPETLWNRIKLQEEDGDLE